MTITIDTVAKTILIEQEVNLSDLMETLKGMFPNGAWKEYKLKHQGVSIQTTPYNPWGVQTVPLTYPDQIMPMYPQVWYETGDQIIS